MGIRSRFAAVAMLPGHKDWDPAIKRNMLLYDRPDDIRSPFARDYNRILHSTAYRRLKHKTQVFFATSHDHVCTRIEHVNHVTAVSYTMANHLGLNTELTNAIALGHDLGHAPFGHAGESIIREMAKELNQTFWHEKNSLRFVDSIETLEDPQGSHQNLNLTYAVRDGIICHCGEVDDTRLTPRTEPIDLSKIQEPGTTDPYTWEACIVKIADKVTYLGRDIEDAITLKLLKKSDLTSLKSALKVGRLRELNTTVIMHSIILDLCNTSDPDTGIVLSEGTMELMQAISEFNYQHIYHHWRVENYKEYAKLILRSLYDVLRRFYQGISTIDNLRNGISSDIRSLPVLTSSFGRYLAKYSAYDRRPAKYRNQMLYDLEDEEDYLTAILDFISGMTDAFAIRMFQELVEF